MYFRSCPIVVFNQIPNFSTATVRGWEKRNRLSSIDRRCPLELPPNSDSEAGIGNQLQRCQLTWVYLTWRTYISDEKSCAYRKHLHKTAAWFLLFWGLFDLFCCYHYHFFVLLFWQWQFLSLPRCTHPARRSWSTKSTPGTAIWEFPIINNTTPSLYILRGRSGLIGKMPLSYPLYF